VRTRQRLEGVREVPVLERVGLGLAVGETATCVVERRLGAPESRIDPRDLPLAAREVRRGSDLRPVVARGMRGVDQLVVLLGRPLGKPQQRPGVVEEIDGELAPLLCGYSSLFSYGSRSYG